MKWTDIYDIAIDLEEAHPDVDIMTIRFTDLQKYVMELEHFDDIESRCNEKILEAIQASWMEERG